eukprot:CAMPEP_0113900744 /NCGR_PEP_ID=MMETSP0780_2-20120614/20854_1 /TAXON_ID=652834 /ORGANISM="Palpitomonas bilix" /LENGTH=70 /DNA_ID=CAMNT_0000893251 /DNA_START=818 /DNA_END=1030 /DNA_ORIENTATION=- /assembly_acc=CAM_ASM_000599
MLFLLVIELELAEQLSHHGPSIQAELLSPLLLSDVIQPEDARNFHLVALQLGQYTAHTSTPRISTLLSAV